MEKLIIIDGNSLINRAYYALPPLATKDGNVYNAVFGFVNIVIKLLTEHNPSHMVVAFDAGKKTFRNELFSDYKGTRKGMPEELKQQLNPLKDLLKQMNIKTLEKLGIEADDIIGTISKNINYPSIILTGDKDCLQLIDDKVEVWLTKHGISEILDMNERHLKEEMGLTPKQIIDLKSLMGDASDNIPGVAGIGEKTAKTLLESFGSMQNVYAHIDEISGKTKEKLIAGKDMANLSYVLATIKCDCDIDFCLDDFKVKLPFSKDVLKTFEKYEFNSLTKRQDLFLEGADGKSQQMQTEVKKIDDILTLHKLLKNQTTAIYETENGFQFAVSTEKCFEFLGTFKDIAPVLEDESITKIFHKLKPVLHKTDGKIKGKCYDLSLAVYLLNSNLRVDYFERIAEYFNFSVYDNACVMLACFEKAKQELEKLLMLNLYEEIELPLVYVLFKMENNGILIDEDFLNELSKKFSKELTEIVSKIYELAGEEFNLNSPKKLGYILFEKLGLSQKDNKKLSTAVDKLEAIKKEHPIVSLILRYRTISKLLSTYVEGLRPWIKNGKIHTTFNQTMAVTGRLSSLEPNLQNIPIRTDEGKILRKMFKASPNSYLVSADYSQIELRLLAHYSGDKNLIEAYKLQKDIHTTTASQIFHTPYEQVTGDMRRTAKAVNFGIIYGISPFGLSKNIGSSMIEAKEYIDTYFNRYPTIKTFLDNSILEAKQKGYVTTLLGRRRNITEIYSTNHNTAMFGERAAMNMPLQGTASDIIKLAMLKVDKALTEQKLKSKLILQIHDELILDVPEDEVEQVKKLLKECMENVVSLKVPLTIDISIGKDWYSAK